MKNLKAYVFIGIVLLAAWAYQAYQARSHTISKPTQLFSEVKIRNSTKNSETLPIYAGCKNPRIGHLKFNGKVIVHHSFAQQWDLKKNPEVAVKNQLKYLQGYFAHGTPENSKFNVYLLAEQTIDVRNVKPTTYKNFIYFDPLNDEIPYPIDLQKPQKIGPTDRAFSIAYSAEQSAVVCGEETEISIALPFDPYLAFWLVNEPDRKILEFGRTKTKTNPCAFSEMASLPFPSMYWYAWSPFAKRENAGEQTYDCRQLLTIDQDYWTTTVEFVADENIESVPLNFRALSRLSELKVDMIMGLSSQTSSRKSLDDALAQFQSHGNLLISAESLGKKTLTKEDFLAQDQSILAFLYIVDALRNIAELEIPRIEDQTTHLLIHLSGVLKESRKPFRIKVFFGSTDEPQKKAQHWEFLKNSLSETPIVFYVGHAGMGQNLDLKILGQKLNLTTDQLKNLFSHQTYQLFGVISCFANYYNNDDYVKFRDEDGLTTDFMLTAQNGYPFLTPVSILHFLDLYFAGKNVSLEKALHFGLQAKDIVIYRRKSPP